MGNIEIEKAAKRILLEKLSIACARVHDAAGESDWVAIRSLLVEATNDATDVANRLASPLVWFAVGDVAAHDGYVTSRVDEDAWTGDNPSGWTYQQVCGTHGCVLYEGDSEVEAKDCLEAWLADCPANAGGRCYTHAP